MRAGLFFHADILGDLTQGIVTGRLFGLDAALFFEFIYARVVPGKLHHSTLAQPIGPAVAEIGNEAAALSQQDNDERGAHIPETAFAGAFELQLFALFGNHSFEQGSYSPRGADLQPVEGVFDHDGQIFGDASGGDRSTPVAEDLPVM